MDRCRNSAGDLSVNQGSFRIAQTHIKPRLQISMRIKHPRPHRHGYPYRLRGRARIAAIAPSVQRRGGSGRSGNDRAGRRPAAEGVARGLLVAIHAQHRHGHAVVGGFAFGIDLDRSREGALGIGPVPLLDVNPADHAMNHRRIRRRLLKPWRRCVSRFFAVVAETCCCPSEPQVGLCDRDVAFRSRFDDPSHIRRAVRDWRSIARGAS